MGCGRERQQKKTPIAFVILEEGVPWLRPRGFHSRVLAKCGWQFNRRSVRSEGDLSRHPVPGVQPGDLVGFGQRWLIERILDEIIDSAFEVEHGLADMDQLGGALAEDVDAEQPAGL